MRRCLPVVCLLVLIACGSDGSDSRQSVSGEEVADRLEKAAEQSTPTSKRVLEKSADQARKHENLSPVEEPDSFAQKALEKASKAEAQATAQQPPDGNIAPSAPPSSK